MTKSIKLIKTLTWIIVAFVILVAFSLVYFKVLITRASERRYVESSEAKISQKRISIGASDYGYINEIKVKIGDVVNEGDVLFKYTVSETQNEDDQNTKSFTRANREYKEVEVKSFTRSRVKQINFYRSSYITKDDVVMELQSAEITVNSIQTIKPEDISKITVGAATETILPDKRVVKGTVKAIYPYYNSSSQSIEVESTINVNFYDIIEGVPVTQKIFIEDNLSDTVDGFVLNVVKSIPNEQIRNFYFN